MDLYYSPVSAFSHKVRMAFFEKKVDFNPIVVNLADQSVRQEYCNLYPLGKVPCLKTANEIVGESTNIIEWLDNHYQVGKLIPEKAEDARQVRYWDRIADQYISQNAILLFFQGLKAEANQDPERIAIASRQIGIAYSMLEAALREHGGDFLVADRLTLADISVACGLVVSQGFVALDQHPLVRSLLSRVQQRDTFVLAREGFESAVTAIAQAFTARD